jgi:hypothetical protein
LPATCDPPADGVALKPMDRAAAAACSPSTTRTLAARLTSGGQPDPTFDGDGFAVRYTGVDNPSDAAFAGRGRPVILETVDRDDPTSSNFSGAASAALLVRLTADGAPDPAFGPGGGLTLPDAGLGSFRPVSGMAVNAIARTPTER